MISISDIRSVANIYAAITLTYICTSSPIAFTITFYLRWKTIQGLDERKVKVIESEITTQPQFSGSHKRIIATDAQNVCKGLL